MFIADETHEKLMAAHDGLNNTRKALVEAKWAGHVLQMILTGAEIGDVMAAIAVVQKNAPRINALLGVFAAGETAANAASSAIEFARTKIPNTTPPDPRGFESYNG